MAVGGNGVGIAAMLLAMASFVINDAFTKVAGEALPVAQIMVLRGMIATLLGIGVALSTGTFRPLTQLLRPAIGYRAVGEIGATLLFLFGLMNMPFAETNAILQFTPLVVTAGSALFLGERVGWRRWGATFVGLFGVLLIVQPGAAGFNSYSLLVLLSVAFIALRDLATLYIDRALPSIMIAVSSSLSVLGAGVATSLFQTWVMPTPAQLALLAGAGVFLVAGYYFITVALRQGEVSVIAPFRYSIVIYAIATGYLIWGTVPNALAITGVLVVAGAGLYTFRRERDRRAGSAVAVPAER